MWQKIIVQHMLLIETCNLANRPAPSVSFVPGPTDCRFDLHHQLRLTRELKGPEQAQNVISSTESFKVSPGSSLSSAGASEPSSFKAQSFLPGQAANPMAQRGVCQGRNCLVATQVFFLMDVTVLEERAPGSQGPGEGYHLCV